MGDELRVRGLALEGRRTTDGQEREPAQSQEGTQCLPRLEAKSPQSVGLRPNL
jgi:hypothetical protein